MTKKTIVAMLAALASCVCLADNSFSAKVELTLAPQTTATIPIPNGFVSLKQAMPGALAANSSQVGGGQKILDLLLTKDMLASANAGKVASHIHEFVITIPMSGGAVGVVSDADFRKFVEALPFSSAMAGKGGNAMIDEKDAYVLFSPPNAKENDRTKAMTSALIVLHIHGRVLMLNEIENISDANELKPFFELTHDFVAAIRESNTAAGDNPSSEK